MDDQVIEVRVVLPSEVWDLPNRLGRKSLAKLTPGQELWVDPGRLEKGFFLIMEPKELEGWVSISALAPTGRTKSKTSLHKDKFE